MGLETQLEVRLVQAVLHALTVVMSYLLARQLLSYEVALMSAVLVASSPALVASTTYILSESVFTFLWVITVLLLVIAVRRYSLRWLMAAGAAWGVSALCRPGAMLMPLPIVALLLARGADLRQKLKLVLLPALFMILTIAPWTVRNSISMKAFIPVSLNGGYSLWVGNYVPWGGDSRGWDNSPLSELAAPYVMESTAGSVAIDRLLMREAIQNALYDPVGTLRLYVRKLGRAWRPVPGTVKQAFGSVLLFTLLRVYHLVILGLAIGGTAMAATTNRPLVFLAALVVIWTFLHALFESMPRYMLPIYPELLTIAAYSIIGVIRSVAQRPFA